MFFKKVRITKGGKVYYYLRLIESFRDKGRVRQRVIANLGNIQTIKPSLIESLAKATQSKVVSIEELRSDRTFSYGDILFAKRLWEWIGLDKFFKEVCSESARQNFNTHLAILIMVINRLILPKSKLKVWDWYREEVYIDNKEPLGYQHFLRAMDYLIKQKDNLERFIFSQLVDLFNLKLNLVFYDLTSSYFEGSGPEDLARFGYSRDRRKDKKQIILGLVVTDRGLPIAHYVFSGNTQDKTTLEEAVKDLEKRFEIKRVIFVGDRGLVSEANIEKVIAKGYEYIFALRKRASRQVRDIIDSNLSHYTKINQEGLLSREVIDNRAGIRYIICHNSKKAEEDRIYRERIINETEELLNQLKDRINKGKLRDKTKIIEKASQIVSKRGAKKFFQYSFMDGFNFQLKEDKLREEEILDGKFILKTNSKELTLEEVVKAYKNLSEVEDAFKEIKDFIRLRPIYHYKDRRVKAHVFICVLAYLLEKVLANMLEDKKIDLTARGALEKLGRIKLVENKIRGIKLLSVTRIAPEEKRIFKLLKISDIPRTKVIENIKDRKNVVTTLFSYRR